MPLSHDRWAICYIKHQHWNLNQSRGERYTPYVTYLQVHLYTFLYQVLISKYTDASKIAFGAFLVQKSTDGYFHPVQYMIKKNPPQEGKLSSYELEVLEIIETLKKFCTYSILCYCQLKHFKKLSTKRT